MGITIKSIDAKSTMRKISFDVFQGSATNNSLFVHVPYACKYDKMVFCRATASATCKIDISNVTNSSTLITTAHVFASASGVAGTVVEQSASADIYVTANSILNVVVSGTTTDGALSLIFSLDDSKEK